MAEIDKPIMRDVLNFLYCPRIVFFERVLHQRQFQTYKQNHGIMKHSEFVAKAKRIMRDEWKLFEKRQYEVAVYSTVHGYKTVADSVMFSPAGDARVVQFKPKIPEFGVPFAWKVQMALEAIAAEETLEISCPYGYVAPYEEGAIARVEFDDKLRERSVAILEEVKALLMKEEMPEPTRFAARCRDCMYRGRLCEGACYVG